jgi:alpha-galactosidase
MGKRIVIWAIGLVLLGAFFGREALPTAALENGLARTPPMGWNSWYAFRCNVDEALIRQQADMLVRLGLRDVGYRYVILDDCWQGDRDAEGRFTTVYERFPSGIKSLADYIHGRRLKFGIYTSRGDKSCMNFAGSQGYEQIDAQTFAAWGADYVKYDNCPYGADINEQRYRFELMGEAIRNAGRPMIYSMSMWQFGDWQPNAGNLSRTNYDIEDRWDSMMNNFDVNSYYAAYARPGYWNDPDVLYFDGGMNLTEYQTHFTLWAVSAAPLIISANLNTLRPGMLDILRNRDVIAFNQDPAGKQAFKLAEPAAGLQVWAKPLSTGEYAITLLNRTEAPAAIAFDSSPLNFATYDAKDVWGRGVTRNVQGIYTAEVQPHGAVLLRVTPR